jgi:hypothetical protein
MSYYYVVIAMRWRLRHWPGQWTRPREKDKSWSCPFPCIRSYMKASLLIAKWFVNFIDQGHIC